MTVRKQDFHDDNDDEQTENARKRTRITIDVSPEMRRRIKMAALQNDLSIGEYVGRILEQIVPDETTKTQQRRPATRRMLEELRQLREAIMQDRNGQPFEDSTEMIRQMREERSKELEQL
jgi:hypothetical protein